MVRKLVHSSDTAVLCPSFVDDAFEVVVVDVYNTRVIEPVPVLAVVRKLQRPMVPRHRVSTVHPTTLT